MNRLSGINLFDVFELLISLFVKEFDVLNFLGVQYFCYFTFYLIIRLAFPMQ